MSDSLLAEIKKYATFHVQITLDGNRHLHDSIRITPAKTGTYDTIIENIDSLVQIIPGKVCIRINVSSPSLDSYKEVVDVLSVRYQDKIHLSFATVFKGQKKRNETELNDIIDILELIEYAKRKGYDALPALEYAPCVATMRGSFAIDEQLNVYTCPARLYEKTVGTITKDAEFLIHDNEWYKALYERKTCVETCMYGGLCYGGCIMPNMECRKALLDRLLPYVVNKKIEKHQEFGGCND